MSAVGARAGWWMSLLQPGGAARGDIAGGLTAAVVLLAVEGSYGLVAFSRLGPEQAQTGFVRSYALSLLAGVLLVIVTLMAVNFA